MRLLCMRCGAVLLLVLLICVPGRMAAEEDLQPQIEIIEVTEEEEPIEQAAPPLRSPGTLPLPQPQPRPVQTAPRVSPQPRPFNLDPDPSEIREEVRLLAAAKRFDEALDLLRSYRARRPDDDEARRLELAIEIAQNEHRMRALVIDQSQERLMVLADPDYLTAKAAASRPVVRRLDVVEFLVAEQRFPEALSACNAILEDHPYDEAVLTLKNSLLRTMVEIERRRALRDRDTRHREVMKEVIDASTMPRQSRPIAREILVFDEDLAEIDRRRVQDRLRVVLDAISYQNAPVAEVLRLLFAAAGMNYIILDEAISEQTVSMYLVESSVSEVLGVLQNMVDIRFNYRGGTVYVTNSETPILVTEIIRLASGLTDVMMPGQFESMAGGDGSDRGSPDQELFPSLGGNGSEPTSDLERFLERIEDLVDWPEGSRWYIERKSNTLYVRSSPSTIAEVRRLLHALDFNSAQVLIEAKFVEVSENAMHELGVDWKIGGVVDRGSDVALAGGARAGTLLTDGLAQIPGSPGGIFSNLGTQANPELARLTGAALERGLDAVASPGLNLGIIGAGSGMNPNFEARIRAMEARGNANTLSEPKILTVNNSSGIIEVSRDRIFVESFRNIGTGSRSAERDEDGRFVTTGSNVIEPVFGSEREGIRLRVVPSVARNSDIVTLSIFPSIKQFLRWSDEEIGAIGIVNPDTEAAPTVIRRPVFGHRQLATALHVRNGQTVVLGGLITEESSETRRGIPFLSSLPLAGALFRTDSTRTDRRKLLIFVTARIIDPSGAELGEEQRWLRDTARVILPTEVQQQLRRQDRERQEEAEQVLEERLRQEEASDATPRRSSIQAGRFRER